MSLTIRELVTSWGFEIDEKPLKKLDKSIGELKEKAKGLVEMFALEGGGLVASLFEFTKAASETGEEIHNTSERIGISTGALQEYRYAATLSGITTENFDNSLRKLSIAMSGASEEGEGTADAFARLGVQTRDSSGKMKPVDTVLSNIADGLTKIPNQADRVALAQKLMGRESGRMVNLLQKGSGALAGLREEARETGSVMDSEAISKAVEFQETWKNFTATFTGLKNEIGIELLPLVRSIVMQVKSWIQQNREFIKQGIANFIKIATNAAVSLWSIIMRIVQVVGVASKLFGGFGNVLRIAAVGFAAFKIIGLAQTIGETAKNAWAAGKAFFGMAAGEAAAAWEVTAIVLGIILLGLAIEDVVGYFQGKDSFFGDFVDRFGDWFKKLPAWGKAIGGFLIYLFPFLQALVVIRDLVRFFQGKESVLGNVLNFVKSGVGKIKNEGSALLNKAESFLPGGTTPASAPTGGSGNSQENNIHIEQHIDGGDPQKTTDATMAALNTAINGPLKKNNDGGAQ